MTDRSSDRSHLQVLKIDMDDVKGIQVPVLTNTSKIPKHTKLVALDDLKLQKVAKDTKESKALASGGK